MTFSRGHETEAIILTNLHSKVPKTDHATRIYTDISRTPYGSWTLEKSEMNRPDFPSSRIWSGSDLNECGQLQPSGAVYRTVGVKSAKFERNSCL